MTDHLEGLNVAQKETVLHKEGPLLIVAGAGAGKTKAITHRILNLIKTGVAPRNILAITFTNKAAKEMRDRIMRLIGDDAELNLPVTFAERPFVSTFHALGVHIVRENSLALGIPKHFTIADEGDAQVLMKEAIISLSLDPKQFEPKRLKNVISRQKGDLVTAEKYAGEVGNEYFPRIVSSVWLAYEKLLREHGSLDFDDLILKAVLLLKRNEEVRTHYQNLWQYIHIDEYQDTNVSQYEFSKLLAGERKNICVVGDMDQSIYSWRGADFRNILNFEKDYPEAKVVLLEENYRSTANILTAANDIIKKNKIRKEKNLFTKKEGGEKIGLYSAYDENDEAFFVAGKTTELISKGVSPKDIAVLYRANFQSRVLEEAFLSHQIPYQVLGVKFFERKEVKDVLSFLRCALNQESLANIKRIINVPPRGIGKVTLLKMFAGEEATLPAGTQKKVSEFRGMLEEIREYALKEKTSETVKFIMSRSGIEAILKKGTEDDKERLENIKELVTLATKYDALEPEEGVSKLLEDAALASDQDSLAINTKKEEDAVRLMTVHASKGLEFPYVFITGLEQDLFPHGGFGNAADGEDRAEEERRLFYVALTRAEKKCYLTYASVRTIFGSKQVNAPSEFIIDIDAELIEDEQTAVPTISLD
ncbi:MAG: UvrD-helicase domain-containing protein [Patescibacteria group bacterium]|nr:UvrD-helicase domain-containing protein [Patescibacteria group bacterium]